MQPDLHNTLKIVQALPATRVADDTAQVGSIIDRAGYHGLEFAISIGTLADANATFAVLVEEGADSGLSDAAAVADGDLLGTEAGAAFTFADDDEVRKIGYTGTKRYVRLTITPSGNSGNADLAAVGIMRSSKTPESSQEG